METPDGPEDVTPTSIDAAGLFGARCSFCHGAQRQGIEGIGPALTPESLVDLTDEEIRNILINGVSGTAMPSFGDILSTEEIEALLRFIKDTIP